MALPVRAGAGEHHPQAQLQKPRNGRGRLDALQVQAVGPFQLPDKLALDMEEGWQNPGNWLTMQRLEPPRRRELVPYRRPRFAQNEPIEGRVFEWSTAGEALRFAPVNGGFDGLDFPLPDHSQVSQALLDTPLSGRRTPIESGFAEALRQFVCLFGKVFKYVAMFFQFREHYQELYPAHMLPALVELTSTPWAVPVRRATLSLPWNWKSSDSRS